MNCSIGVAVHVALKMPPTNPLYTELIQAKSQEGTYLIAVEFT